MLPWVVNVLVPLMHPAVAVAGRATSGSPPASTPRVGSVSPQAPIHVAGGERHQVPLLLRLGAEHRRCARRTGRCAPRPTATPTGRPAPAPRCRCSSRWPTSRPRRTPRETGCPSGRARPSSPTSARGKRLRLVPLRTKRTDFRLGELADGPAQHLLLLGRSEVHRRECSTGARGSGFGARPTCSGLEAQKPASRANGRQCQNPEVMTQACTRVCLLLFCLLLLASGFSRLLASGFWLLLVPSPCAARGSRRTSREPAVHRSARAGPCARRTG